MRKPLLRAVRFAASGSPKPRRRSRRYVALISSGRDPKDAAPMDADMVRTPPVVGSGATWGGTAMRWMLRPVSRALFGQMTRIGDAGRLHWLPGGGNGTEARGAAD